MEKEETVFSGSNYFKMVFTILRIVPFFIECALNEKIDVYTPGNANFDSSRFGKVLFVVILFVGFCSITYLHTKLLFEHRTLSKQHTELIRSANLDKKSSDDLQDDFEKLTNKYEKLVGMCIEPGAREFYLDNKESDNSENIKPKPK